MVPGLEKGLPVDGGGQAGGIRASGKVGLGTRSRGGRSSTMAEGLGTNQQKQTENQANKENSKDGSYKHSHHSDKNPHTKIN